MCVICITGLFVVWFVTCVLLITFGQKPEPAKENTDDDMLDFEH